MKIITALAKKGVLAALIAPDAASHCKSINKLHWGTPTGLNHPHGRQSSPFVGRKYQ